MRRASMVVGACLLTWYYFSQLFVFLHMSILHPPMPTVTTTSTSSICLMCGVIKKSGLRSCCGHGGSWFGNCGSTGNSKHNYTWRQGIEACKTQKFRAALVQRLHVLHPKSNAPIDDGRFTMATHRLASTQANMSTKMQGRASTTVPARTSAITPAHTLIARNAGTTTSKARTTAITTISVRMLISESGVTPANAEISDSTRSALAVLSTRTSLHMLANKSIATQQSGKLLNFVTRLSMIFVVVCW